MSPFHAICFASVDWCGASFALAWSPKNGEVFQIGCVIPPPLIVLTLYDILKSEFCSYCSTNVGVLYGNIFVMTLYVKT